MWAESDGNPCCVSGSDIGLFQIEITAHPHCTRHNMLLPIPNTCAATRFYITAGRSWRAWSTAKGLGIR